MTQDISISFSELRGIAKRIVDLVGSIAGVETNEIGIKTAINDDLGVDGDDWYDLSRILYERERIDLNELNFYDYFQDEGQIANAGVYFLLFFPARLLLYVLTFRWKYKRFDTFATMSGPPKKPLTIGDLITSKVAGRFVTRQSRRFVIAKNSLRA